jgi:hypothetical protein
MTLLMIKLRIVHSRMAPAFISALRAHVLSFRAKRGISHSEAYASADGDSSALARLRMTGDMRACAKNYTYEPTCYTSRRAEREICAGAMRIRATRTAVTISGHGYRHGKESTGNAVSGFLFGDFFKSEKVTRGGDGIPALSFPAGRNPASPVRAARDGGDGIPALSFPAGRNPASPRPRAAPRR